MTTSDTVDGRRLAEVSGAELLKSLSSGGIWLQLGAACVRLRSDSPHLASQLIAAYPEFSLGLNKAWADVHVDIMQAPGLRRWLRPQVVLRCDSRETFDPFPADSPLPLFEWGCNWLLTRRRNDMLLLHAGTVEKNGRVMILPALPGSGKSTLTAALSLRGWRLLSDEFGVLDPSSGEFHALLKPVCLKNQSIQVIRRFAPDAAMGPEFPKTRKGIVAHLAAQPDAVARRSERAVPGAVVLPRWEEGSSTQLKPMGAPELFSALAFNAFNYATLGAAGFESVVRVAQHCPAWQLVYSDLDDAVTALDNLWTDVIAGRRTVAMS